MRSRMRNRLGPLWHGGTSTLVLALETTLLAGTASAGVPEPRRQVTTATYDAEYKALLQREGVPFVPQAIGKDLIFNGLVILGILGCAASFGPKGPEGVPDPTYIRTVPRPDVFFLWLYAVLALLPDYLETFLILVTPMVGIALLFALPFIAGTGEKSARRRPVAVLTVVVIFLVLGILTSMGTYAPRSPHMEAWSGAPVPVHYLEGRSPLEVQGALVLQNKQCRNCHSLNGSGGQRGPALDDVATRLTGDQLVRQVI